MWFFWASNLWMISSAVSSFACLSSEYSSTIISSKPLTAACVPSTNLNMRRLTVGGSQSPQVTQPITGNSDMTFLPGCFFVAGAVGKRRSPRTGNNYTLHSTKNSPAIAMEKRLALRTKGCLLWTRSVDEGGTGGRRPVCWPARRSVGLGRDGGGVVCGYDEYERPGAFLGPSRTPLKGPGGKAVIYVKLAPP